MAFYLLKSSSIQWFFNVSHRRSWSLGRGATDDGGPSHRGAKEAVWESLMPPGEKSKKKKKKNSKRGPNSRSSAHACYGASQNMPPRQLPVQSSRTTKREKERERKTVFGLVLFQSFRLFAGLISINFKGTS